MPKSRETHRKRPPAMSPADWDKANERRCNCGARLPSYPPNATRCRHCNQEQKAAALELEEKRYEDACRMSGHRAPRYMDGRRVNDE